MTSEYSGQVYQVKPVPVRGGWSYSLHIEGSSKRVGMEIKPDGRVFHNADEAVEAGKEWAMSWIDRAQLDESGSVFAA